jgi:hypothetical protein
LKETAMIENEFLLGMVVHACNSSTQEASGGGL